MIFAAEENNNNPDLLSNFPLSYLAVDTWLAGSTTHLTAIFFLYLNTKFVGQTQDVDLCLQSQLMLVMCEFQPQLLWQTPLGCLIWPMVRMIVNDDLSAC